MQTAGHSKVGPLWQYRPAREVIGLGGTPMAIGSARMIVDLGGELPTALVSAMKGAPAAKRLRKYAQRLRYLDRVMEVRKMTWILVVG